MTQSQTTPEVIQSGGKIVLWPRFTLTIAFARAFLEAIPIAFTPCPNSDMMLAH